MPLRIILATLVPLFVVGSASAQPAPMVTGIEAQLRLLSTQTPVGQPVLVRFLIENTTDEPITLTVPGTEPQIPSPEINLPIGHVFSGGSSFAVTVTTDSGQRWETPVGYRSPSKAPILMIGPRGSVGTTLDIRDYFPACRGAGRYRITWSPYAGAVAPAVAVVTIAPYKQAEIVTDQGKMRLKFYYRDAPAHVANFIELARSDFFTGKTFHRIEPGYLLQGGCPRGDGTGIRTDGKRIPVELNLHGHEKGSVSMALLDDDPDSGSCQFFISNTRQKEWDSRYTVFAQLVGEDSFSTLVKLMSTPVDDAGRPTRPLFMRSVRIIDAPPDVYYDKP